MIGLFIWYAILTVAIGMVVMARICEDIMNDMAQANSDFKKRLEALKKSAKK